MNETARLLALDELLDRRPKELSGGQRQRVAMGRALVRQPKAFLMDEPLSNLHAKLRVHMRGEIAALQKRLGITTVYVTHDQIEAMTMGDRVAVINMDERQQVDTPAKICDDPVDLLVAGFIGSPPMNLVHGRIEARDGVVHAVMGSVAVALPPDLVARRGLEVWEGREVIVGIRPEDVEPAEADGEITRASSGSRPSVRRCSSTSASRPSRRPRRSSPPREVPTTPMRSSRWGTTVRPGDEVHLTLPPERLHLFDPDTETTIREAPPTTTC